MRRRDLLLAIGALGAELARIEAGRFEVWITHQVNIGAFIGESVPMGGAWLVHTGAGAPAKAHNLGRLSFEP
jgi:hypothetical protein